MATDLTPEQDLIRYRAQQLLDVLTAAVPHTTMHYAVTDIQDIHLPRLIRTANTIQCTPGAADALNPLDPDERPRSNCGCGFNVVYTGQGWQHDAAPWFWGNDHDVEVGAAAEAAAKAYDAAHPDET